MLSVLIYVPEQDEPIERSLQPGSALLIGRRPNPAQLDAHALAGLQAPMATQGEAPVIQTLRVQSALVSSNHLLLVGQQDGLLALDLNSRNGTFVLLSPGKPVRLAPDPKLAVCLAGGPPGKIVDDEPEPASWVEEHEFAEAVALSVRDWLREQGVRARIRIGSASSEPSGSINGASDEGLERLPLADGSELRIDLSSGTTHEVSWVTLMERLSSYVARQNSRFEQLRGHEEGFILASPVMRQVHSQIAEAAAHGLRVVLLGPTGAGKDSMARCYHRHSRQHRGPFVTINCALLRPELLYAQLFGARRGSFTGSVADLTGVVEKAHEGTLFLDEVGDMDLEIQKTLLRFLDSRGEYLRLGDSLPRRVNVQVVCATNAPLDDPQHRQGRFRDDLWYRLAVKVLHIPPLSERREDILSFLRSRMPFGGSVSVADALTPEALQLALNDAWPGNFRDLEHFVNRLPGATAPRSIGLEACRAALGEGRRRTSNEDNAPVGVSSSQAVPIPMGDLRSEPFGGNWPEVAGLATSVFIKDHGTAPSGWGQLQLFMEKYLKPVFVAHAAGLAHITELSRSTNFSEIARKLNIADGTTVKLHLIRYIEGFRRAPGNPGPPAGGTPPGSPANPER